MRDRQPLATDRGAAGCIAEACLHIAAPAVETPVDAGRTDARVLKTRTLSWILGRVCVRLYFRAGGSATPRSKANDVSRLLDVVLRFRRSLQAVDELVKSSRRHPTGSGVDSHQHTKSTIDLLGVIKLLFFIFF